MGHSHHHHDHSHNHLQSTGNIRMAFWLNTGFAILELAGGIYTNSVAITTDALHDFGDSLSLGLAHYFEKKSTRRRDEDYSYGYRRFSLLGALINSLILIVGSVIIIQEAVGRIVQPEEVDAKGMLVLAIAGIAVNTIAMLRLRKGSSVNERVVALHFLEDVLGWAAVLIGSIVMLFVYVPVLDPILSILIAGFILFNVYKNLRRAFRIILQGIPENIDMDEVKKRIMSVPGVRDAHDLHSWTLDGRYNIMTVHIVLDQTASMERINEIKKEVRSLLEDLKIQHLTVETELEDDACALKNC